MKKKLAKLLRRLAKRFDGDEVPAYTVLALRAYAYLEDYARYHACESAAATAHRLQGDLIEALLSKATEGIKFQLIKPQDPGYGPAFEAEMLLGVRLN